MLLMVLALTLVDMSIDVDAGVVYHGNPSTKKFHQSNCRYYNCAKCTAFFSSHQAALNAGYVPCGICKP
jgi:methylphosphotriester-DNA--protein-cysteine methyltransferase